MPIQFLGSALDGFNRGQLQTAQLQQLQQQQQQQQQLQTLLGGLSNPFVPSQTPSLGGALIGATPGINPNASTPTFTQFDPLTSVLTQSAQAPAQPIQSAPVQTQQSAPTQPIQAQPIQNTAPELNQVNINDILAQGTQLRQRLDSTVTQIAANPNATPQLIQQATNLRNTCLLYTSPSPRDS